VKEPKGIDTLLQIPYVKRCPTKCVVFNKIHSIERSLMRNLSTLDTFHPKAKFSKILDSDEEDADDLIDENDESTNTEVGGNHYNSSEKKNKQVILFKTFNINYNQVVNFQITLYIPDLHRICHFSEVLTNLSHISNTTFLRLSSNTSGE
jgi:hypothetical protein